MGLTDSFPYGIAYVFILLYQAPNELLTNSLMSDCAKINTNGILQPRNVFPMYSSCPRGKLTIKYFL